MRDEADNSPRSLATRWCSSHHIPGELPAAGQVALQLKGGAHCLISLERGHGDSLPVFAFLGERHGNRSEHGQPGRHGRATFAHFIFSTNDRLPVLQEEYNIKESSFLLEEVRWWNW